MASRKEAQIEACSFLKVGLGLQDEDLYQGFAQTLAKAVDEDILEDAPKFNDRFFRSVQLICDDDNNDAAVAAAEILFLAYDQVCSLEGIEPIECLMAVWGKLPKEHPLHPGVLKPILDCRGTGAGRMELATALLQQAVERSLMEKSVIAEWAASPEAAAADDLVEKLKAASLV